MATIKSYTDLEQSRKLAEFLPLESADMSWVSCDDGSQKYYQAENRKIILMYEKKHWIPCWSLAALLNVMICPNLEEYIKGKWDLTTFTDESLKTPIEVQDCESAVDACYEMILKLKENNLI